MSLLSCVVVDYIAKNVVRIHILHLLILWLFHLKIERLAKEHKEWKVGSNLNAGGGKLLTVKIWEEWMEKKDLMESQRSGLNSFILPVDGANV